MVFKLDKSLKIFFFVLLCFSVRTLSHQNSDTTKIIPVVNGLDFIQLNKQFNDLFEDPAFSNALWGVVIQSLNTGEILYKKNENLNMMPASNMKLFTTACGLLKLGPEFKYETSLYLRGKLDDETIYGDLILRGRGDPTITGRFYNDDPFYVFSKWADSLISLGIEEISGNIIADDDAFDDVGLGEGWSWDDETYYYSAPSSAVSFNDNCVDVTLQPGTKIGNKSLITFKPNTRYTTIFNDVITVSDDSVTNIDFYRERGTNLIYFYGTIRQSEPRITHSVSINNPTQFTAVILKEVLESKGIKVRGYAVDIDDQKEFIDYSSLNKLLTSFSPSLEEIVKVINKRSHNLYAEQLLKTIGLQTFNYGSIKNGVKACEPYFLGMGIDPSQIKIVDGSGLSRMNLVTPMQINKLLSYMYRTNVFNSFYNSLPIAGVDGTISRRMVNTKAQNNVRAKTGYIFSARSLSGYVTSADGELFSFSMIANNFLTPVKIAEYIQDQVCNILANISRGKKINEQ